METVVEMAERRGLRVSVVIPAYEVPCYKHARIHGASNFRTFQDGWRIEDDHERMDEQLLGDRKG